MRKGIKNGISYEWLLMCIDILFNCGDVRQVHADGQSGSPACSHSSQHHSDSAAFQGCASVLLSLLSQMCSNIMGLASISNFHIYNLLKVLEKGECMAESESELISSQSTLLAQGISLTNLISTVAKQRRLLNWSASSYQQSLLSIHNISALP